MAIFRIWILLLIPLIGHAQHHPVRDAAVRFLETLNEELRTRAVYPYADAERLNWAFVPRARNGISFHDMNNQQANAAIALLEVSMSVQGFKKATGIIALEDILRQVEGRNKDDTYRDPLKYYFTIFGDPRSTEPWGWRIEGHHLSLNFTSINGEIQAATPTFMGANPATIPIGLDRGKQVLKLETDLGFLLVNSLSPTQLKKARFSDRAFPDIITGNNRHARQLEPAGISYGELDDHQKKILLNLLDVYVENYQLGFSKRLMEKIRQAGIENLSFAWAGSLQPGEGHYYRIQGPTLLIEYDNTQNNANHAHTVVRDLTNDFAEDILREHYKSHHESTQ